MNGTIEIIDYDTASELLGLVANQTIPLVKRGSRSALGWIGLAMLNLGGFTSGLFMYETECMLLTQIPGFPAIGASACATVAATTALFFVGTIDMAASRAEHVTQTNGFSTNTKVEQDLGYNSSYAVDLEYYYNAYSVLGLSASLEYYDFSTYYLIDGKVHGNNVVTMLCHGDIGCNKVMHGVDENPSVSQAYLTDWATEEPTTEPL